MELEIIILSKSDRERQISDVTTYCGILKKKWYKWIYLQNRNRLTDLENKLVFTRWKGGIIGIDIYIVLYLK